MEQLFVSFWTWQFCWNRTKVMTSLPPKSAKSAKTRIQNFANNSISISPSLMLIFPSRQTNAAMQDVGKIPKSFSLIKLRLSIDDNSKRLSSPETFYTFSSFCIVGEQLTIYLSINQIKMDSKCTLKYSRNPLIYFTNLGILLFSTYLKLNCLLYLNKINLHLDKIINYDSTNAWYEFILYSQMSNWT